MASAGGSAMVMSWFFFFWSVEWGFGEIWGPGWHLWYLVVDWECHCNRNWAIFVWVEHVKLKIHKGVQTKRFPSKTLHSCQMLTGWCLFSAQSCQSYTENYTSLITSNLCKIYTYNSSNGAVHFGSLEFYFKKNKLIPKCEKICWYFKYIYFLYARHKVNWHSDI